MRYAILDARNMQSKGVLDTYAYDETWYERDWKQNLLYAFMLYSTQEWFGDFIAMGNGATFYVIRAENNHGSIQYELYYGYGEISADPSQQAFRVGRSERDGNIQPMSTLSVETGKNSAQNHRLGR